MADKNQNPKNRYEVRNTFPGKAFSKPEQQRIAAQISNQLTLHKESIVPRKGET